jgi:glucose/arabinose dehydrogenase
MRKKIVILWSLVGIFAILILVNCGGGGEGTTESKSNGLEIQLVAEGLAFPVTIACTSDGRIFFNELRTGKIRIIQNGTLLPAPFATVAVSTNGENGLIGLTFDPDYESNGFVYIFHTHPNPFRNRVVRFTEVNNIGTGKAVIIDNLPAASIHIGGNIGFGPDRKLYLTIGDVSNPTNSQSLDNPAGKILRYNSDGSIPQNNPFPDSPIFALGLRNSFDFAFHPITGVIYATENGPDCDDEINRIIEGDNYGWRPSYPCGDKDTRFIGPILRFPETIVPTGITFYTGDQYPEFSNDLFFVNFDRGSEGKIQRIDLSGDNLDQIGSISTFLVDNEFGGLLDIITCSDGNLYFSNSSSIMRIIRKR